MQWSLRIEGPDAAPPRFLEIQAGCDLLVWKRDYFCGVSYAMVRSDVYLSFSEGARACMLCTFVSMPLRILTAA